MVVVVLCEGVVIVVGANVGTKQGANPSALLLRVAWSSFDQTELMFNIMASSKSKTFLWRSNLFDYKRYVFLERDEESC